MLKQTVQRLEGYISASRRKNDVHMKWKKRLFGNWVRSMSSKPQSSDNRSTSYSVPKERVECVVIGAGVVGIAVARALALKGREVLVVESAPTFGTGTSSRSSEVIHAGIYYPANSFKVGISLVIKVVIFIYPQNIFAISMLWFDFVKIADKCGRYSQNCGHTNPRNLDGGSEICVMCYLVKREYWVVETQMVESFIDLEGLIISVDQLGGNGLRDDIFAFELLLDALVKHFDIWVKVKTYDESLCSSFTE